MASTMRTSQFLLLFAAIPALLAEEESEWDLEADEVMEHHHVHKDVSQDEADEFGEPPMVGPETIRALFKKMDKDADGWLSRKELDDFAFERTKRRAMEYGNEMHSSQDKDEDGRLTLEEVMQFSSHDEHFQHMDKQKFHAADKDKDGALTKEEAAAYAFPEGDDHVEEALAKVELERKDLDKDGALDMRELFQTVGVHKDTPIHEEEEKDFQVLDTNGDGKLDLHEMKSYESGRFHTYRAMAQLFKGADLDRGGSVSEDELVAAWATLMEDGDTGYHLDEWATEHTLEL